MNGYKAELHEVRTRDGWKLSLVRLMVAPKEEEPKEEVPKEEEEKNDDQNEPSPDLNVLDEEEFTPIDENDGESDQEDPSPTEDDTDATEAVD
jgi:hypothetical protein